MQRTDNLRIRSTEPLIAPGDLKKWVPQSEIANETVLKGRADVIRILTGEDQRLLAIVGPCSIHDPKAALEYAARLAVLRHELADQICIVMRVYFEKPRTTVGWRGFISDPRLDDSCDMAEGLRLARNLLVTINEMGLPAATEMLDPVVPQYIADLVSWAAIGARTTESQTHRQMASGLSMPVGFKNGTDGNIQVAVDAMLSARTAHSFLGVDDDGRNCIVNTMGNPYGHLVLRGGRDHTNFDAKSIAEATAKLTSAGVNRRMMVDCSHGNTRKQHELQGSVWDHVVEQHREGSEAIMGLMLESHLQGGSQKLEGNVKDLRYGVSITDACVDWETTETLLRRAHATLNTKIPSRGVV